ncbi:DUF4435 domain-containing protein [Aquabacterium sp.]|uniref:DUF4435 domain-containing protein n=1 Tax=Aquabacterium sp. TaxID=1872578 RepID=UPI003BF47C7D
MEIFLKYKMSRLTHSRNGAIRAMQISSAQVFAFVEGGLDRTFAERILSTCGLNQNQFRVFAIKEVNNGTGGKQAVLQHFKEFRSQGRLYADAWGKKLVSIFFADKDADDFLGVKLRSPHLIYTPTYDVEGVLFGFGNLLKALTEACLITIPQANELLGDAKSWIKNVATHWVDWITLCLISQQKKKNTGYTFDRISCINPDLAKEPDADKLLKCKNRVAQALIMQADEFEKYYQSVRMRVISSIENGQSLRFFKGKWLKSILQSVIDAAPRIEDANKNGIGERVCTALLAQVASSANCNCVNHYKTLLDCVLIKVK